MEILAVRSLMRSGSSLSRSHSAAERHWHELLRFEWGQTNDAYPFFSRRRVVRRPRMKMRAEPASM